MKNFDLERLANWIGIPGLSLYVWSMLLYPWIKGQGDWKHVQAVWDQWQTLNAALIAFAASLIALNISRVAAEKQRAREFSASRAFLPAAFSELSLYFNESAVALSSLWNAEPGSVVAPTPPSSYRDVFKDCIRHATPQVGAYLASVLVNLQIHEARIRDAAASGAPADKHALISYLYSLGNLKVAVDKQYGFARGESSFDELPATWEDFRNAYGILELHLEHFEVDEMRTLKSFTERALARRG